MKTEYEIYMDFRSAMAQAEKLRNIANSMTMMSENEIRGTLAQISGVWSGNNADSYCGKGSKVKSNIGNTASKLKNIAAAIETIAIRTRDAELAAIRIAET